jgi:hypothetical protein
MCLSLFARSVQKQPTRCASRPKLIRASGATNAAFATADWLTRTTFAGHVHQHRRRAAVGSEPGVGADDDVVLHVDLHRADRHDRPVPAGLHVAEGERARRQRHRTPAMRIMRQCLERLTR